MAVHEYKCDECGKRVEIPVKLGESSLPPRCVGHHLESAPQTMRRVYQLSGFTIK